jgi:hypothetical protein
LKLMTKMTVGKEVTSSIKQKPDKII